MIVAIAILFTYLTAMIVAGHGALPMGGILVLGLFEVGRADSWFICGMIAGWIGIIGLVFVTCLFRSNPLKQLTFQFAFCVILYLSWLAVAMVGIDEYDYFPLFSSFVLSAPFQVTFLIVTGWFVMKRRQISADSDNQFQ